MQEINLLVEQKNGTIGGNFEELKAALKAELEVYKNMVFTEETRPEARKAVANLRKLKKSMNDKKLEVKKTFMVPYTDFESQVEELDKLIDEPINFISGQIEEFERKRVEERKKLISDIYAEIITEHDTVTEYLPLQRIYDSKCENSTTTKKAIKEGIMKHVEHVEKDLATIRSMESEFEDKGIAKYKTTLELSDALTTMNQYQKQKEDILRRQEEEAQKKAEEEARRAAAEEKRKVEEEVHKAAEVEQKADPPVQEEPIAQETVKEEKFVEPKPVTNTVVYEIIADPFQIVQLESAMREYGIKFRRI